MIGTSVGPVARPTPVPGQADDEVQDAPPAGEKAVALPSRSAKAVRR